MKFGETLRTAREAKGYTIAQVAEKTHMAPSSVQDLENENFTRIVAPIYGRGFVKLYCEAVGLDPKPLIEEFMAIFTGERDTEIRERPTVKPEEPATPAPAATPTPAPAAAPTPTPAPHAAEDLLLEQETIPPPIRPSEPDVESKPLSRYATPIEDKDARQFRVPSALPRIILLAVIAFALLAALFFSIRMLYRATSGEAAPIVENAAADLQNRPLAPEKGPSAEPRKQQKIPALYID